MLSLQDFLNVQDLTSAPSVTGAQLNQILTSGVPFGDKGLIGWTTDTALNTPVIPNPLGASNQNKWAYYLWGRIQPATATVSIYFWNPNGGSGTLLQWQSLISSIPLASIIGAQIAALTLTGGAGGNIAPTTITDYNMASISGAKVLANTLPGSSLISETITNTALSTTDGLNILDANVASIAQGDGLNPIGATGKIQVPAASAYKVLGVNSLSTQLQWFVDYMIQLISVSGIGTAFMPAQVNAGATGLQWKAHDTLQIYTEQNNTSQTSTKVVSPGTPLTTSNADLLTHFGSSGTIAFTPLSANSKILIEINVPTTAAGGDATQIGLFNGSTLLCSAATLTGGTISENVVFNYWFPSVSTTTLNFHLYVAAATTNCEVCQYTTDNATVKITEYL
jgi:hypothetical protein